MKRSLSLLIFLFLLPLHICAQTPAQSATTAVEPATMRSSYGQKLHVQGVPNAGKITDILYRGAQPREAGLTQLKAMGITTIVDLRQEDRDAIKWERQRAEAMGLRFVHIPVNGWNPPTDEQVVQFFAVLRDNPAQKVFVHCHYGDDRTGVFIAVFRMVSEKWPAEQAVKEMFFFGFNGRWHPSMKTFVQNFPSRMNTSPGLAQLRAPALQP